MKSFERVCPSEFINRVAQYGHMLIGRMHTFFNFTCLLMSFTRYLFKIDYLSAFSDNLNCVFLDEYFFLSN